MIAKDVFLTAMNLIDQESEDGTYEGYPVELKKKAWPILTLLQAELTPAAQPISIIADENGVFSLDDRTASTCLPYGLASHLMMDEDQNKAAFFNARFDELKMKRSATMTSIKDVYWEGSTTDSGGGNSDGGGNTGGDTGGGNGGVYDGGEW